LRKQAGKLVLLSELPTADRDFWPIVALALEGSEIALYALLHDEVGGPEVPPARGQPVGRFLRER
jgi:hypothetical protein